MKLSSSRRLYAIVLSFILLGSAGVAMRAQQPQHHYPNSPSSASDRSMPLSAVPEKREEVRDENYEYRHSPAVQKLGHVLGLDPEQAATAFTVFNFLVLAIGIGYVAVKWLPKAFRARNTAIQRQLVDARTATEEANARLNSVEARLSKLDGQIAAMRSQAESETAREETRLRASVEEEKQKILAAAESEIQTATVLARRAIQQYAAELAIEQAARKLVVTAETDRLLVESFARQLTGEPGGQN